MAENKTKPAGSSLTVFLNEILDKQLRGVFIRQGRFI
jgi:hypothetical protein